MDALLQAWQEFWREDGHVAAAGFSYREAGPHLMLMAFLQAHLNGRGRQALIEREYGLGRKALDLMVSFEDQRFALEIKIRRDGKTLDKGLAQLSAYLDLAGLQEGYLILFDPRKSASWKQRLFRRRRKLGPHTLRVIGC